MLWHRQAIFVVNFDALAQATILKSKGDKLHVTCHSGTQAGRKGLFCGVIEDGKRLWLNCYVNVTDRDDKFS